MIHAMPPDDPHVLHHDDPQRYIVPPMGSMFGLSIGVLMAPLAVQEMVMAGVADRQGLRLDRSRFQGCR
jgi:hypothetical protein